MRDSGYKAQTSEQQERSGVLIGSGIGGAFAAPQRAEVSALLGQSQGAGPAQADQ